MPFPVDIVFVRRAEERLGVRLPLSYKARICRANGGQVKVAGDWWHLHPIFDDSDRRRIRRTGNDIVYETNHARKNRMFPDRGIVIGQNVHGDLLCFLASAEDRRCAETVFCWYGETGEFDEIADDFLDLFPEVQE